MAMAHVIINIPCYQELPRLDALDNLNSFFVTTDHNEDVGKVVGS